MFRRIAAFKTYTQNSLEVVTGLKNASLGSWLFIGRGQGHEAEKADKALLMLI